MCIVNENIIKNKKWWHKNWEHRQQMGILTMMRQRLLPNCKIKSDERGMILPKFFFFFFSFVCSFVLALFFPLCSSIATVIVAGSFFFFFCSFLLKWSTYEFIHYDYVAIRNTNPFRLLSFSFSLIWEYSLANDDFHWHQNCAHNLLSDLLKIHV